MAEVLTREHHGRYYTRLEVDRRNGYTLVVEVGDGTERRFKVKGSDEYRAQVGDLDELLRKEDNP